MKNKILEKIDPILDRIVAIVEENDEDRVMGTLMRLEKEVQKESAEAAVELSLLVFAMLNKDK